MVRGIFGLDRVYKKQVQNIKDDNFESWPESATYGYFGCGLNPAESPIYLDTIDRIDFSNETTSAPGNDLPQARLSLAAVSSNSYGYFGGGFAPPTTNTVDRIDFSNETTSAPGNNLPQVRAGLAALSSSSYGYFGGGEEVSVGVIQRLDFSNETLSLPGNNLPQARRNLAALSSSSYGYFGGGYFFAPPGTISDTVYRIDFSNETTSAPGENLPQARSALAAVSSSSYGYFGGGYNPAESPSRVDTIDRIDFSNETTSAPTNNLLQARSSLAAVSSNSYGYFGGGASPTIRSTIDRLDFSNETTSPVTATLPQGRSALAAVSGGASQRIKGSRTYGYFGGGSPSPDGRIDRIDFSNETTSEPGNNLPQPRSGLAALSSNSYGYFGGGSPSPDGRIDRIDFSNETTSAPGNNLPQGRSGLAAVSSSSYGYFGGGSAPPQVDKIDRIDFSNETTSAPGNNLTQARNSLAAVSSSSYGYFGGGFAPPSTPSFFKDTIDRIDFSNETTSPVTATLTQGRNGLGAVSSSSYGYFAGGGNGPEVDTVDRIDFSNETISTPGNNLPQVKAFFGSISSSSYGYLGGGQTNNDKIDRIDFSNETTSPVTATLSQGRNSLAAVSN
jgi:hypothetical protein